MEINLLPRRSPWEAYRTVLLVFVSLLVLLGVGSVVLYRVSLSDRIDIARAELLRTRADTVQLTAERKVSPQSKQFADLKARVDALAKQRHDYGRMLDAIAARMSERMRITSADMDTEKNRLTLLLDTESIDAAADYAQTLREEAWVQDVFVSTIENKDDAKTDTPFQAKLEILLQPEQNR